MASCLWNQTEVSTKCQIKDTSHESTQTKTHDLLGKPFKGKGKSMTQFQSESIKLA